MEKVLLFCDPGIDDAVAIIYALLNPRIDLVGVVTGYGNVNEKQATENASYLLQLGGRPDIPVIRGAKGPFSGELVSYYPEIHGPEGLGPIRPPDNLVTNVQDYRAVFDLINLYKNDLTLVDVGRSTSLATSFILKGAEEVNQVKGIYIMGGAFNHPGNVTAVAEANFFGDPIATDLVLEKGRNVTVIPLNVTNYALVTPQVVNWIAASKSNPYSGLIKPIIDYYINAYKKLVPGLNAAPMHDVITLFALTSPGSFQFASRRVRVESSSLSRGRTIADFRANPKEEQKETLDHIALAFDYNAFIQDFINVMTAKVNNVKTIEKRCHF
ncbi:purine nucleosidase [Cytobacillus oceanisediminis]|uniref:Purine nucleosidase n=1 Tax=Cytobacillus oceanisediminis TaxID=665099 RepID=A0A2V2ZV64_9BACI|nr:nucleoside hydrolase [Cytobacillus oceanisediminis]PWW28316.1 purine nucleosidase [Cytobacillus oceanisediminis]